MSLYEVLPPAGASLFLPWPPFILVDIPQFCQLFQANIFLDFPSLPVSNSIEFSFYLHPPLYRLFGLFLLLFLQAGAEVIPVQPFSSKRRCWIPSVALAVSYELQCFISFLSYPMCILYFYYCFCLWCNWNFYCLEVWSISCYLLIGFYSSGVMAREVVCLVLFTLHVLQLVVWCRL